MESPPSHLELDNGAFQLPPGTYQTSTNNIQNITR